MSSNLFLWPAEFWRVIFASFPLSNFSHFNFSITYTLRTGYEYNGVFGTYACKFTTWHNYKLLFKSYMARSKHRLFCCLQICCNLCCESKTELKHSIVEWRLNSFPLIINKTPTHALFIQHHISLACWFH